MCVCVPCLLFHTSGPRDTPAQLLELFGVLLVGDRSDGDGAAALQDGLQLGTLKILNNTYLVHAACTERRCAMESMLVTEARELRHRETLQGANTQESFGSMQEAKAQPWDESEIYKGWEKAGKFPLTAADSLSSSPHTYTHIHTHVLFGACEALMCRFLHLRCPAGTAAAAADGTAGVVDGGCGGGVPCEGRVVQAICVDDEGEAALLQDKGAVAGSGSCAAVPALAAAAAAAAAGQGHPASAALAAAAASAAHT
eukprot:1148740-Pelagomonas_calceolata.AAC.3